MKSNRLYMIALMVTILTSVSQAQEQQLDPLGLCGMNTEAVELALQIIDHPAQQRPLLQCNQKLTEIAQARAQALATNSADPEITPNQVVIDGGFRFASYYPISGNQVEAVARDTVKVGEALNYLTTNDKHKPQVLGEVEFFELQSQMGVGYYTDDDPSTHPQWVVLTAQPWNPPKIVYKQEFNMPVRMAKGCEKDWQNSNDEFLKRKCGSMSKSKRKRNKDSN